MGVSAQWGFQAMQPPENKPVGIFPYLVVAILISSSSASAYSVDIKSSKNLEVSSSLQNYELTILKKIGETLKGFDVPQKGAIKVTISEKGSFTNITFLSPRPEKSVRGKIKRKLNSLPLEKIPGANGSTSLTLECEIPELNSPNPFRSGTNIGAGIVTPRFAGKANLDQETALYNAKKKQLSNQESVSESFLIELIVMAVKRKSFEDAADFQKIYLDKTRDKYKERADLKFMGLMNLCKYLILAGEEKDAALTYKEALSLEKDESFNNKRTRVENYFADVSRAWADVGYLNEADDAMRKSIDYEKPTPRGNKRFTNTIKALNTLIDKYEAEKEFEKASKLLEYKISKSQPDDRISLRLKLAFLQLTASKESSQDKTSWLKRSLSNFDLAIKAIEKSNGADSYSYKSAIRKWVERLDKNGYEEEANAQEKLLI